MIKLIIFDWDDVFTQGSIKGYYACYHAALEAVGVRLDGAEEACHLVFGLDEITNIEASQLLVHKYQARINLVPLIIK